MRIILVMVDITNHEDALKELSKTSLVNEVVLILCWSAQEAARYLELYKNLEHAGSAAIKARPPASYSERVVEFATVPKGLTKVDAITLVSGFGTLRNAVNADPEAMVGIPGWGQRKVQKWTSAVEEPFLSIKAAKKISSVPSAGITENERELIRQAEMERNANQDMPDSRFTSHKSDSQKEGNEQSSETSQMV